MSANVDVSSAARVTCVNGIAGNRAEDGLTIEALRQRVYTELLRQEAQRVGLLEESDVPATDGAISEGAAAAIAELLEREVAVPVPSEDASRRYYAARQASYRTGERVRLRHVLFAVTPGVDVVALRKQAETAFLALRCAAAGSDTFASTARAFSNCPSGREGGDLGWIGPDECVPELAHRIFGGVEIGVLSRIVPTRFGFHVVEILERDPGQAQPFEAVRGAVAMALRQQAYVTALRQYLRMLAGVADVSGVDLASSDTLLVQ